jgi:hypothetical protein
MKVDTPIYVMEMINDNGIKILPVICVLPDRNIFKVIDENGEFYPAIFQQIHPIINAIKGNISVNTIINTDVLDENGDISCNIPNDEDVLLVLFIKDYRGSTQTFPGFSNDIVENDERFIDCNITNQYFKNATFLRMFNVQFMFNDNLIQFGLYNHEGTTDVDPEIINKIKNRIYLF